MSNSQEAKAREAVESIIASSAGKKLIVAGPGAGKTYTFRKILESDSGTSKKRIVLTFLNNLKDDLEADLSEYARVHTFHGYCHGLLRKRRTLRDGLTEDFEYYPDLPSLINRDWEVATQEDTPGFVPKMRRLEPDEPLDFYFSRANYYNAVSYDDSIYRVHRAMENPKNVPNFDLVLVDEYQDFNKLEASFLDLLAADNTIIIAGDDDQALYSQLRDASPDFIRQRHASKDYECFELPFCMRCTEVVVGAVNDVIRQAKSAGLLQARIDKPYEYYPPLKQSDSEEHPKVVVAQISAQSKRVNYFGKFIEEAIEEISQADIAESHEKGFPTVLIIGSIQYLRQIEEYLLERGHTVESKSSARQKLSREDGLRILEDKPYSNVGWRIVLEDDQPEFFKDTIQDSIKTESPLIELISNDYRDEVWSEVRALEPPEGEEGDEDAKDTERPTIRLTSFEGSKGLSAQYVFIAGMHLGDLPRTLAAVDDLEVCKFLVALSRARKRCHLLHAWRFSGKSMKPSPFLDWVDNNRKQVVKINKGYWKGK